MAGDCIRQIPRWGFVLSLAATILMMAAASAPSLFYPQIAERLGLIPVATTLVFAVYTFTLLAALLYLGPLSDHVGRRPVVAAGSLALALSVAMFWFAGSLAALLVARALQGLAAGLLIPALSAMMIDFESPSHRNIAALWNTIGPMIGLGAGALGAALLLDLTSEPTTAVFGSLVLAFLIVATVVWSTPELAPKTQIRRGDLRPRFTVPPHLRRMFTAGVPVIIAGWATNGLFLALGADLVGSELGGSTHTQAGIVLFALAISGVTASSVLQRRSARTISLYATSALAFGTAVSIGALALGSYSAYVASVAIVGSGFGTAFLGVLRTLMPHTASSERAAVMAVIYTVAYLAFGVPTIVAGLLVPVLTLSGTMTILGAIIIALSLVATVLRLRIPHPAAGPAETDDFPEPPTGSHRRSAPDREEQP